MSDLTRYGLQWNGPSDFVTIEMDDGYWTPWHIAEGYIATLDAKLAAAEADAGRYRWLKVSEQEPPYGEHILIALQLAGGDWFICYGFVQSDWSLRSVDDECIGYKLDDGAYWRPVEPPIDKAMGRG